MLSAQQAHSSSVGIDDLVSMGILEPQSQTSSRGAVPPTPLGGYYPQTPYSCFLSVPIQMAVLRKRNGCRERVPCRSPEAGSLWWGMGQSPGETSVRAGLIRHGGPTQREYTLHKVRLPCPHSSGKLSTTS